MSTKLFPHPVVACMSSPQPDRQNINGSRISGGFYFRDDPKIPFSYEETMRSYSKIQAILMKAANLVPMI
jgi:hypothetical protein